MTSDPVLLAAAAALRRQVFVDEQGVDPALEADGRDSGAVHVVLAQRGRVAGTARIIDTGAEARLGRLAISASARGRGLGRLVMQTAEGWATSQGLPAVALHAQESAVGFYRRLGYSVVGEPFQEAGIPHVSMRKELLPGIRPGRDDDADALQTLIAAVWAEYPGMVLDIEQEEPWLRAPGSAYAAEGELWVVPLPDGAGLLGSVGWRPLAQGAELKSLYVAAGHRRQGWGSRLVRFIERRVGGPGRLRVWSDTRFRDSHAMYERLGYRRTGASRELGDRSHTVELEFAGTGHQLLSSGRPSW